MCVQIISLGSKWALPRGNVFYICLNGEKVTKSSSLKPRHRVLIFGIDLHHINLFQISSNYVLVVENGSARVSHVLHRINMKGKHK